MEKKYFKCQIIKIICSLMERLFKDIQRVCYRNKIETSEKCATDIVNICHFSSDHVHNNT